MFTYAPPGPAASGFAVVTERFLGLVSADAAGDVVSALHYVLDSPTASMDEGLSVLTDSDEVERFALVEVLDTGNRAIVVAVHGDVVVDFDGTASSRFMWPRGARWVTGEATGVSTLRLSLAQSAPTVVQLPLGNGVVECAAVAMDSSAPGPEDHVPASPFEELARHLDLAQLMAKRTWTLVLPDGNELEATPQIVVGRRPWRSSPDETSTYYVVAPSPHRQISGKHVEFAVIGDQLHARDLDSTNGTLVMSPDKPPQLLHQGEATCYRDGVDVSERSTVRGLSIADAVDQGADIISVSMSGGGYGELEEPIATALQEGVIIVASLSNGDDPNDSIFDNQDGPPGTMNGVVSVLAAGPDGALALDGFGNPNVSLGQHVDVVGPGVDILANGYPGPEWQTQQLVTGTSFATPIVAGTLALAMDKYPDATPNQILQSMIHNTGNDGSHDAEWFEDIGYGLVSPRNLLAADPTQYDDVNPFIAEDWPFGGPRIAQIFGEDYQLPSATPSPSPTPGNEATDEPNTSDDETSSLLPIILIAAVVLLLVIGAIITIAVITSRKSQKGGHHGQV